MASKMERSSFLCMELFQEDKCRLCGGCAIAGGSDDLAAKLGANVASGKDAGDIGAHFRISHNKALCIKFNALRQKVCHRRKAYINKKPVNCQLFFLARLEILNGQASQMILAVQLGNDGTA